MEHTRSPGWDWLLCLVALAAVAWAVFNAGYALVMTVSALRGESEGAGTGALVLALYAAPGVFVAWLAWRTTSWSLRRRE